MTCVPSPALPPVCCDPTLLRIVTVNLLDNAVKYGNEGGDIRVKAEVARGRAGRRAAADQRVELRAGLQPRRSRTSSSAGSRAWTTRPSRAAAAPASGLYNSWRIVQLHKGRITADSKHGEWAEFSFEIPATADCAEPARCRPEGVVQ